MFGSILVLTCYKIPIKPSTIKLCNLLSYFLYFSGIDPEKTTMQEVYDKFGLDANTASFTGHALALYRNDE